MHGIFAVPVSSAPFFSALCLSVLCRLFLVFFGVLQDYFLRVKFTDVDYIVMTDAARLVASNQSPYGRATYRYTPVFAWLLLPCGRWPQFGKLLFNLFDLGAGCLCFQMTGVMDSTSAYLCLLNPFTMIISSRGNAEAVLSCLTMLALKLFFHRQRTWLGAFVLGVAVHVKLYPIIYIPSMCVYIFWNEVNMAKSRQKLNGSLSALCGCLVHLLLALAGFAIFSTASVWLYGRSYLDEAFFYHFRRKDIKHNFSPYFLPLYLMAAGGAEESLLTRLLSYGAFVPQVVLAIAFALYYGREDLAFCWFITTYSFVIFNKVCTSQYFVWYITFLPIIYPRLMLRDLGVTGLAALWLLAQGQWLLPAYLLEFYALSVFRWLWLASMSNQIFNVAILSILIRAYK